MSNDLTKNPWAIDTAASTVLTNDLLCIKSIRWVSAGASAGDAVSVQDKNGRVIWSAVANGANYDEAQLIENQPPFAGLKVPTLSSGTVYIQLA